MISALGLKISAVFRRTAPDPFVIVVLLTVATAALAVCFGFPAGADTPRPDAARRLVLAMDAWGGGLWNLLAFGMQMCLILVTGHALAESPPIRRLLRSLAAMPRTSAQAVALVTVVACLTGLLNWGLGLIAGAVVAREVGRSASRRGIAVHYPLLAAAGYMGLLVFHGGLSGSAPLAMSTLENARNVLRPEHVALLNGRPIGLDRTLASTTNLLITGGMVVWLPLLFVLLTPRDKGQCEGIPRRLLGDESASGAAGEDSAEDAASCGFIPEWLERSPWVTLVLALGLGWVVWRFVAEKGAVRIGFDQVNTLMFALGLAMHGSVRSYLRALEQGAAGCAGIIVQFPLYAGVMGMMSASGLTRMMAEGITAIADNRTLAPLTFIAATLVGLFIPSGGAQWSIQGPIALESGARLGVDPGTMVMAVAYGDELANMLQPFWALPLLAITGAKAREIVGYTAIVMVAAGLWMALGLWLF